MLLPHHLNDLRRSGLTDTSIEAARIHSETDHHVIAGLLNRKRYSRQCGPAMVFPFFDEAGTVVLHRVKPDNPPQHNGKPAAKYLSPTGAPVRAYVPPSVNGQLVDVDRILVICEGEKKALKGTQEGFLTIGLTGVDCWHSKQSSALIPDLGRITWKDRRAFIVFDSDATENTNVRDNENLLAAVLQNHGAVVKIVRLPPGPDGEKVGLDDFLCAHTADDLHKLLNDAADPEPPDPEAVKLPGAAMVPEDEAKRFLTSIHKDGYSRLIFWCESFWAWSAGCFHEKRDAEVRSTLLQWLEPSYFKVSNTAAATVLEHVKARCIVYSDLEPPCWLGRVPGSQWPPHELLCCRNKIVHLPSLVAKTEPWSVAPTPALFNTASLDFGFLTGDACQRPDRWLQFLSELWPNDPESIEALQFWFGYSLTPDTRQHKLLVLIGPKRSGKTTIAKVLRALVGRRNAVAPTLSSLASNFGLAPLIGKTLAVIGDARLSGRQDGATIVERILSITGEDALTVDRKHLPMVTVTFPVRFMVLSNELPRLADASGTLASRMIVLRLTESWFGREDKHLADALMKELPAILWWAIEGWRKLQERGSLIQPQAGAELLAEMQDLSSPVGAFVREACKVDGEYSIPRADLYLAYVDWCKDQGRKHVEDEAMFGRNLHAAVPRLGTKWHRVEGTAKRCYIGITLQRGF